MSVLFSSHGGRTSLVTSATLFAAIALAAPAAHAQTPKPEKVRVVGIVIDQVSGQPLVGALVKIDHARAYTDSDGRFVVNKVERGTHVVSVDRLGYVYEEALRMIAGDDTPLRIEVEPRPIVLEAISVINNRLERRLRSVAVSARVFEGDDFSFSSFDAFDFVKSRAGLFMRPCPPSSFSEYCVYRRGSVVEPTLYIDEMPIFGGLEMLQTIPTSELYRLEVYDHRHVRVYTRRFAEYLALHPRRLQTLLLF